MTEKKRLLRSMTDKQVAGVCAGIANYFNVDPTIVRLAFVLATLIGGPGLIIYIALWIAMPENKDEDTIIMTEKRKTDDF
jgi:phage shock protein C